MKVFLTGGTGYVGSAVLDALIARGHEVTALVRERRDGGLPDGARILVGAIGLPEAWSEDLQSYDAVVSCAYERGPNRVAADRTFVEAVLAREPNAFVYTSGVMVLGDVGDGSGDESASTAGAPTAVAWRPAREHQVVEAATDRFATAVIRPGMVYGGKRGGHLAAWFKAGREGRPATIVGEGANRWSWVHREDLGQLYARIVERGARGVFHGVRPPPVRVREVAEAAVAAAGGSEVRAEPLDEARKRLGPIADALARDMAATTSRAGEVDWIAGHPHVLDDLQAALAEWST